MLVFHKYSSHLLLLLSAMTVGCGTSPEAYVDRGNHFFDGGKFEDASIQYEKALQKAPTLGEAHYRLGLTDLKRNQPVPAWRELQRASELMPGNEEVLARLGKVSLAIYNLDPHRPKQLYDTAAKVADLLTGMDSKSFDGNLLKGALALIDHKPADAVVFLRTAEEAKPDNADAKLGLARALAQNNQAAEGIGLATDLIQKDKTFGPAYDFLYLQYHSSGMAAEAENTLKLKVDNNPRQADFILELARYYAAAQKPAEVTATVQKLLDRPADFPDGRLRAGDFYASVGKPDDAVRQYQAGLQSQPRNSTAYRKRMAAILSAQRKWPDALQQLNIVLKSTPDDSEAKLIRALAWLGEGKPENLDPAIVELRAQTEKKPQDSTLHFELGKALFRKNDRDGARREWASAARQSASYLPPRFELVQLDLSQGNGQDALQIADQILAVAPRDAKAWLVHAACLTAAGEYRRARTELTRMANQFPKAPQVQFRLGVLDMAEHKYKEAEEVFGKLESSAAGDPQVLAGLAEAYAGENESGKAIQLLEDEVKRNPGSPVVRQVLARFAAASGRFDIAIEQYKQLAAIAPRSPELQLSLASAYSAGGDHNSAVGVLDRLVQSDPKSAAANMWLARELVASGRLSDAKADYRKVLALQPNNGTALNDLAFLMADSGENLDEALSYAQRGLQNTVDPGLKSSLSDTLGWIYLKKNASNSALPLFQNLVNAHPDNATYRYHLGLTLFEKGDKQGARTELETALAHKPDSANEPKIRQLLAKL
jgi:tetratricopeptide (TPR) repeat protein